MCYSTSGKDCLLTLWSILQLCLCPKSTNFVAKTTYSSLRRILDLKRATSCLAPRRLCLMKFYLEVLYGHGVHYRAASLIFSFPKASLSEGENSEVHIDEKLLAYCNLEQI